MDEKVCVLGQVVWSPSQQGNNKHACSATGELLAASAWTSLVLRAHRHE